jgi:hypothetical protein
MKTEVQTALYQDIKKLCLISVGKVVCFPKIYLKKYESEHFITIHKLANCHICGRSANLTNYKFPIFLDMRFAERICGHPTFDYLLMLVRFRQKQSKLS